MFFGVSVARFVVAEAAFVHNLSQ